MYEGNIIGLNFWLNNKEVDLKDFANSSSPYVVTRHMEGTKVVKKFDCCDENYPSLNFR